MLRRVSEKYDYYPKIRKNIKKKLFSAGARGIGYLIFKKLKMKRNLIFILFIPLSISPISGAYKNVYTFLTYNFLLVTVLRKRKVSANKKNHFKGPVIFLK